MIDELKEIIDGNEIFTHRDPPFRYARIGIITYCYNPEYGNIIKWDYSTNPVTKTEPSIHDIPKYILVALNLLKPYNYLINGDPYCFGKKDYCMVSGCPHKKSCEKERKHQIKIESVANLRKLMPIILESDNINPDYITGDRLDENLDGGADFSLIYEAFNEKTEISVNLTYNTYGTPKYETTIIKGDMIEDQFMDAEYLAMENSCGADQAYTETQINRLDKKANKEKDKWLSQPKIRIHIHPNDLIIENHISDWYNPVQYGYTLSYKTRKLTVTVNNFEKLVNIIKLWEIFFNIDTI